MPTEMTNASARPLFGHPVETAAEVRLTRVSPTLEKITAYALELGRERLYPSRCNPDYLILNPRRKRFAEWLQWIPGNQLKVLDVGGRIQPYRSLLEGRLARYIAIDPLKTGLVDAVAVGEHLPFGNESFDLVLCTQVLCYVKDPPKVIDEIYRVLRPGGALFLSTPAIFHRHAENDRWRYLPDGLRLLLSRFSRVEVSAEGHSLSGACRILAAFLNLYVENWVLRRMVDSGLIPLVNLVGERLDHWSRGDTRLTNNYCAIAQK